MRAIFNESTDPYFNIASDEFILDTSDGDVFMLWRNSPAVIIGKNQNTWAEVNAEFTASHGIAVVRRITGGGAVFHDLGNVNFSFVTEADDDSKLNFAKFCAPIIDVLSSLGVDAALDGRNDIVANGRKISGNAECVRRGDDGKMMMLHHGTLLFGAELSALSGALNVDPDKMKSRGIKSVSSRVANIRDLPGYRGPDDVTEFMDILMRAVAPRGHEGFSAEETRKIDELRRRKFATWEWNWGASPSFERNVSRRFPFGKVASSFTCRDGLITDIKFYGDFFGTEDVSLLEGALRGARLDDGAIERAVSEAAGKCIAGATPRDVASLLTE